MRHTTAGNGSYTHALVRNGLVLLSLLTIGAVAVHGTLVHERCNAAGHDKLVSFVRQGAAQLADLRRGRNAAATTGWETTDGSLTEQFRRWGWAVLHDENVIAVALLDAQGKPMTVMPQDTPIASESLAGIYGNEALVRAVPVRLGGREQSVWRVTAATRRDGSDASRTGLVLFAHRRSPLRDVGRSAIGLAAGMMGGGGLLVLGYGLWFRRRVGGPLLALAAAAERLDKCTPACLPVQRNDGIGTVARAIERLLKRANRSEDQAERLEETMNSRVADHTRQINAVLQQAERAVWIDPLTRLGNRRLLEDRLEKVFEAQKRSGRDMSIVMLDLDNFKKLNDTKGHSAGDEIMRFVGELVRGTIRPTDVGVRYGGDEFAIILVDTTPDKAAALAERFLRLFRQRAGVLDLDPPVSVSAGIASLLRDRPNSGKHLLDLADQALYKAKSRGKNTLYVGSQARAL